MGPSKRTSPFSMKTARSATVHGHVDRLLDQHDGGAASVDLADDLEQLLDDDRRQPEAELVDHQQLGAWR